MADKNTTGAVHLASIDLDISGVRKNLEEIKNNIEETAKYVNETKFQLGGSDRDNGSLGESISKGFDEAEKSVQNFGNAAKSIFENIKTGGVDWLRDIGISEENLASAQAKIQELAKEIQNASSIQLETKEGDLFQAIVQYSDQAGNSMREVIDLTKELSEAQRSYTITDDFEKKNQAIEQQKSVIVQLQEQEHKEFEITKSDIDNLNIKYKEFLDTLSKTKLTESAIGDFPNEVKEAAGQMQLLTNEVDRNGSVTQEQVEQYNSFNSTLKGFIGTLTELTAEARSSGEGLKDAFGSVQQFESLNEKFKKFVDTLSRSKINQDILGDLPERAKEASDEMGRLTEQVEQGEAVTKTQKDAYNNLSTTLSKLKVDFLEIKAKAQESGQGVENSFSNVKSFERLNLQFKNFLNTLEKSKLDDAVGTPLEGIKSKANEAAERMAELAKAVKESGSATAEQKNEFDSLSSTLITLRGELADTETAARRTGEGFKEAGESAVTFGQKIEAALTKLADRAKLMMSYQLIALIQNALGNVVGTIQSTEDAVVDLQRVLNEDVSNTTIAKQLYEIADEFGQTFENVQEVAIKFAQTGKSWTETLDATRATMLGLNTAELEVSTATEGLIATMSQFKIDASELETVIDKINITADHFPVTSEKIVAALQRAGGTASAFNMSLEETIATITALSEATGRSGENIGTALNSLIIYTSKADNLELFSTLSEDMDQVVQKYKSGAASILEVWKRLGIEVQDLTDAQTDALFNSMAYDEFAEQFEAEASEYAEAIQEIYGTAGTYRRNYLTALLQDMGEVKDVMDNMADAEGYSLSENEKYMETLTAKWNQLVIAAKELAVQLGEQGFLDFLKVLTELITGTLKLTEAFGGLRTIMGLLISAFIAIKGQKIANTFKEIGTTVSAGATAIKAFALSLVGVETSATGAATATAALGVSISGALSIISLFVTGVMALVSWLENAKQAEIDLRNEMIKTGQESEKQAKDLFENYNEYLNARSNGSTEDLETATVKLLEQFGYTVEDVDFLTEKYGSLDDAIQTLIQSEYKLIKVQAQQAKEAAEQSWQDIDLPDSISFISGQEATKEIEEAHKALMAYNEELGVTQKTVLHGTAEEIISYFSAMSEAATTTDEAKDNIEKLNRALEILKDEFGSKAITNPYYQAIVKAIAENENFIKTVDDATNYLDYLGDSAEDAAAISETATESLHEWAEGTSDAGDAIVDFTDEIELLGDAFDDLSGKVDSFQSAYSTVTDVIQEYNETGIMTADMLQNLLQLEPEYIAMLDVKANSLGLNESAVENLISANDVYLQQMVSLKAVEEAEALATQLAAAANDGLTFSEYQAAYAGATLQAELQAAIIAEINGTGTSYDLAAAIQAVGQQAGLSGQYLEYFTNTINNYVSTLSSLYNKVNRGSLGTYYTPSVSTPKSSGGSGGSGNSAARKALQNEIKAWQKQKEAVQDYYDSLVENLKKQKEESDDYYDDLIANLKEVEEANDRINAQIDYYTSRQQLLRNIEQAQSRSGIEWREKEVDYQQQLVDLDEDWRRQLEDWSIEDQIADLERIKQQADDLIDAQIEEMKLLKEAAVDAIDDIIEKLQEKVSNLASSTGSGVASGISSGLGAAANAYGDFLDDIEEATDETLDGIENAMENTAIGSLRSWEERLIQPAMDDLDIVKASMIKAGKVATQAAQDAGSSWTNSFTNPAIQGINTLINGMSDPMVKTAGNSADAIMQQYRQRFINPFSQELQNAIKLAQQSAQGAITGIQMALSANNSSRNFGNTISNNTLNFNANISNTATANSAINNATNFFTNPSRR